MDNRTDVNFFSTAADIDLVTRLAGDLIAVMTHSANS